MGENSHWDDRYNKQYYKDFVRYYENNKPDYSSGTGADDADEVPSPSTGEPSAPVLLLASIRWHKLSLS